MKAIPRLMESQRAAVRAEARKQVWEARDALFNDMDAVILWVLHERFGFGVGRLRKFFDAFQDEYKRLQEFYQLGKDTPFVCLQKLKDLGVDIAAWEDEAEKNA